MFHKCSKKDTTATNEKEKRIFLFQGLFAFDMVLAWSVLNANKKEERPIHGWVWQSSKAFEVFLWTRCNPNWDQLGWAAPLQNIVFASVGDQWFAAVMNIRVSYSRRPHQSFARDLLRLNVARNSLNEVPSEALLQLKNLNQLDLSFNKIKYIEENTFAGKSSIRSQKTSYWICGTSSYPNFAPNF